jgi:hypothetical protein
LGLAPPRMGHGLARERKTTQSEMEFKERRSALRAAVYRRDGPAVVSLLRGLGVYDDSLQLAGDGVIAALIQRLDGAPELARDLVVALRQRGWDGDDEPAEQLDAPLGGAPAPMLRALPVDLEELRLPSITAVSTDMSPASAGSGRYWPYSGSHNDGGECGSSAITGPDYFFCMAAGP